MNKPEYGGIGIITIFNFLASGSTLLHSFLDDHPQITSLPLLVPINMYRALSQLPPETTALQCIEFLVDQFPGLTDGRLFADDSGLDELGPDRNQFITVDRGQLVSRAFQHATRLLHLGKSGRMLLALSLAWDECRGRDISRVKWFVYPGHFDDLERLLPLFEGFLPRFRAIHTLRDPATGLFSVARYNYLTLPMMDHNLLANHLSVLFARVIPKLTQAPSSGDIPLHPSLAPLSTGIRLEDMHARPEETMRALARWLEIDWSPVLTDSTVGGLQWWNRKTMVRVSGSVEDQGKNRYGQWSNGLDRWRISVLTRRKRRVWEYEAAAYDDRSGIDNLVLKLCWLPFKMERFDFQQGLYTKIPDSWSSEHWIVRALHDRYRLASLEPWKRRVLGFDAQSVKAQRKLWDRRVRMNIDLSKGVIDLKDLGPGSDGADEIIVSVDQGELAKLGWFRNRLVDAAWLLLRLKSFIPVYIQARKQLRALHHTYLQEGDCEIRLLNIKLD